MNSTCDKPVFVRLMNCQKVFGMSRSTIYRREKAGEFKIYSDRGMSWLKTSEVESYLKKKNSC